jgi:hypothetical protein
MAYDTCPAGCSAAVTGRSQGHGDRFRRFDAIARKEQDRNAMTTTTTLTRTALAALTVGALALPVAADAKGGPGKDGGGPAAAQAKAENAKGHTKARKNPIVTHVFKGTVVSVDATTGTALVKVVKANRHGRAARDSEVTFDLSAARLAVADVNADGKADLADVAVRDKVLVQARLPKGGADLTGTVKARKLVDQTRPGDYVVQPPAGG